MAEISIYHPERNNISTEFNQAFRILQTKDSIDQVSMIREAALAQNKEQFFELIDKFIRNFEETNPEKRQETSELKSLIFEIQSIVPFPWELLDQGLDIDRLPEFEETKEMTRLGDDFLNEFLPWYYSKTHITSKELICHADLNQDIIQIPLTAEISEIPENFIDEKSLKTIFKSMTPVYGESELRRKIGNKEIRIIAGPKNHIYVKIVGTAQETTPPINGSELKPFLEPNDKVETAEHYGLFTGSILIKNPNVPISHPVYKAKKISFLGNNSLGHPIILVDNSRVVFQNYDKLFELVSKKIYRYAEDYMSGDNVVLDTNIFREFREGDELEALSSLYKQTGSNFIFVGKSSNLIVVEIDGKCEEFSEQDFLRNFSKIG